jgi:hypothetical protein
MTCNHTRAILPAVVIAVQVLASCSDMVTSPATLDDLTIRFVSGYMEANLMPIVPPDPVSCQVLILAQNNNPTETLSGLSIPVADVFLDSTNQRLGTITFSTSWDGRLSPNEQDTVRLTKVTSQSSPFTPPCGKQVYLLLSLKKDGNLSKGFKTESMFFSCVY